MNIKSHVAQCLEKIKPEFNKQKFNLEVSVMKGKTCLIIMCNPIIEQQSDKNFVCRFKSILSGIDISMYDESIAEFSVKYFTRVSAIIQQKSPYPQTAKL